MNVILSIHPNFCQAIFNGQKMYEYRKRVFKRTDIDKVYVYASKPICKVIGYFTVDLVIEDTPCKVWQITHKDGGISKEFYDEYFKNCQLAHSIKIKGARLFPIPIDPKSVLDNFHAPQNFMYVDYELKILQ